MSVTSSRKTRAAVRYINFSNSFEFAGFCVLSRRIIPAVDQWTATGLEPLFAFPRSQKSGKVRVLRTVHRLTGALGKAEQRANKHFMTVQATRTRGLGGLQIIGHGRGGLDSVHVLAVSAERSPDFTCLTMVIACSCSGLSLASIHHPQWV